MTHSFFTITTLRPHMRHRLIRIPILATPPLPLCPTSSTPIIMPMRTSIPMLMCTSSSLVLSLATHPRSPIAVVIITITFALTIAGIAFGR